VEIGVFAGSSLGWGDSVEPLRPTDREVIQRGGGKVWTSSIGHKKRRSKGIRQNSQPYHPLPAIWDVGPAVQSGLGRSEAEGTKKIAPELTVLPRVKSYHGKNEKPRLTNTERKKLRLSRKKGPSAQARTGGFPLLILAGFGAEVEVPIIDRERRRHNTQKKGKKKKRL